MAEKSVLLPKSPISRVVTTVMDIMPVFGKIKEHRFTTTLGAGLTFHRSEGTLYEGFSICINEKSPIWTSQELRELAAECVSMAEYLEKTFPSKATTEPAA